MEMQEKRDQSQINEKARFSFCNPVDQLDDGPIYDSLGIDQP